MTLTGNTRLRTVSVNGQATEVADVDIVAEGGEALPFIDSATAAGFESGDWLYSATAEGRTGEVAVNGIDLDDEPGFMYTGPVGNAVRVKVKGLDIVEAGIADAADSQTMAIMLNNTVIAYADEGFVAELDILAEFNADTYVGGLQNLDVIRVAIIGGTEETDELDLDEAGSIDIV